MDKCKDTTLNLETNGFRPSFGRDLGRYERTNQDPTQKCLSGRYEWREETIATTEAEVQMRFRRDQVPDGVRPDGRPIVSLDGPYGIRNDSRH